MDDRCAFCILPVQLIDIRVLFLCIALSIELVSIS